MRSRNFRTSSKIRFSLFTETVQALKAGKSEMRVLTGNDRFVAESYKIGANSALIGVANVATDKWDRCAERTLRKPSCSSYYYS